MRFGMSDARCHASCERYFRYGLPMKTVFALLFLLMAIGVHAQSPQSVAEYLKPLVAAENLTEGDQWEDFGNGGYMIRFFKDVDGDGKPELFLTTSLMFRRKLGHWAVFKQDEVLQIPGPRTNQQAKVRS